MSVSEVAGELAVSPRRVRQMLADGLLRGEQVGRSWIVDRESVREAQLREFPVGRPWSDRSAWGLLLLAAGEEPELSPVGMSRARRRLSQGLEAWVDKLRSRAEEHRFYAHPSILEQLAGHAALVRSGVSAVDDYRVDLVSGEAVEGYLTASALEGVVDQFAMDADSDRPNVVLRVVDDSVWPFASDQKVAPLPVVAIDLLESPDERSRRAGRILLERLSVA